MAGELSYEDVTGSSAPGGTPTGEISFEDMMGKTETDSTGLPPPSTPETGRATAESESAYQPFVSAAHRVLEFARTPSPEWMRPAEKFIAETPLAPKQFFPSYWMGKQAQWASQYLPPGLRQAGEAIGGVEVGAAEAASGVSTPAGIGLIATAPATGAALTAIETGVFLGMAIKGTPEQWGRLKAASTVGEKAQIATEMVSSYLPALALPGFKRLLKGRARDLAAGAVAPPEETAPGGPDVIPPPVRPGVKPLARERDYIGGGETDAVKSSDAQMERGPAPLGVGEGAGSPVTETGRSDYVVGEAQRAEARGNVPGEEPVAVPETVAPTVPEELHGEGVRPVSPYFVEKHGDIYAVIDRRKPSDVGLITPDLEAAKAHKAQLDSDLVNEALGKPKVVDRIQQLATEISEMRDQGIPVPIRKTMELRQLKEGAPPPLVPDVDPRIQQLQRNAADLKNEVGDYLGKKPTPQEREIQKRLWETYDRIHYLREKSGQPRDFVIIGGGAGGLKAAGHAAYEGLDTVVLEKEKTTGGQAKTSQEIVNVGASELGVTGKDYFTPRYLTAKNRGAQIKTGVEVANLVPRADGGVDVITKKHGVIPAKRVAILTGSSGNVHPNMELAGWGNAERLYGLARGKHAAVYGAGNSATQAVFGAIRNGAKKITIISRHKFGPEVSNDQRARIYDLVKKGKVELVTGSVNRIARDPATGGVKVTVGDREIPVAHIENFLDTIYNTGWLPEGIEKVPLKSGKPGPVKVQGANLKTTMPGVYAGGDIAEALPGQRKGRRIDIAEGQGAEIATSVHEDIAHWQQKGKLPEWTTPEPHLPEGIDQHLKALKGLKEETPSPPSTGGTQTTLSPTKKEPTSTTISSGRGKEMPPKTPPTEPGKPQKAAEAAAARVTKVGEAEKSIAEARRATMYGGGEHPDYSPEAKAREVANPRYPAKIIDDLTSGEKVGLDPVDESILVKHRESIQNARDIAGKRALDTSLPKNERANAAANYEDLNAQLGVMEQATGDGRVIQSKSQSLLWHQFRARDYSAPSMETKLQVAKDGAPLTAAEKAKIKTGTDKLESLMTQIGAKRAGALPGKVPPGLRDLQYEMHKAKIALDDMVFHAKFVEGKPLYHRVWYSGRELLAVPRALMASMDLSAIRRQGGILFLSHPIRSLRIMPDMLRAARSDKDYYMLMQDIRERPNAPVYLSSKLGLTEIKSPRLADMEEMYLSRTADYIPLVSHSQRAYVYYLNRLRADTFDAMAKNLGRKGQVTPVQADALSNFINVFTGRGTIPAHYANAAVALNDAFFAPRYALSRFQVITGQPIWHAKDPAVRKMIAGEYARALVGYGVMYGTVAIAAEALGQKIEVSFDPRSTDFGKIKIGDTRIDPLSGLSQSIVLLTRLAPPITGKAHMLGYTKTGAGLIQPVYGGGPLTKRKFGDVLVDFGRSKLAPLPAAYWNAAEGKRVTGEPTTLSKELLSMITPMSGRDIYDAMMAHGVPAGAALGLLAMFGDSVNTYAKRGVPAKKLRPLKPK